jgi:poly(ADP-ribose) glycohydrolase ARH3
MRVAPVGLFFRDDRTQLLEQARLSALPTHVHPLGIEGARLLALATALCTQVERFDRDTFFAEILAACESAAYRAKMEEAARVNTPAALAPLGNHIEALHSVPTAIACFALTPESYEATVTNAIFLGGDTDTIAAMAGALSGACLGLAKLPQRLVGLLENSPKGRVYLLELAERLFTAYRRRRQK